MASWGGRSSTVAFAIALLLCSAAQCHAQDDKDKQAVQAPAANTTAGALTNSTVAPPASSSAAPTANSTAAPSVNSTAAPSVSSNAAPTVNSTAAPSVNSTGAAPSNITSQLPTNPPAGEPADKPTDTPSETPAEKPAGQPSEKPKDNPAKTDKPAGKATDKPRDKPAGKSAKKPKGKGTQKPTNKPAGNKPEGKDTPAQQKKKPTSKKSGQPAQGNPADKKHSKKHTTPPNPHSTAKARQNARQRDLARELAADRSESHFIPIRLVRKRGMQVGKSTMWAASYWIRPQDHNPITNSANWTLVDIEAEGEHSVRGSVQVWKTPCGQLRWNKAENTIRYTAEVDSCEDIIRYTAAKKKNKNVLKKGKARIEVLPGGREAELYTAAVRPIEVTATTNVTAPTKAITQQDSYFIPIVFADNSALDINKFFNYSEGYLLRPSTGGGTASDWVLARIYAKGEKSKWGSTLSWVTPCGYLQWDKEARRVKYTAEVDGCAESFRYKAHKKNNPNITQTGKIKVVVNVDNCFYSRCAHPGCSSADCRCGSTRTGVCGCGGGKVGFVGMYIYKKNRQACVYSPIKTVTQSSTTADLFSTTTGVAQVAIPFRFSGVANKCLPPKADKALEVTSARCNRISPDPDTRKATKADVYQGNANSGGLVGSCSNSDGIYRVVVDVPWNAGLYQCYVTFNDDIGQRALAQLTVKRS